LASNAAINVEKIHTLGTQLSLMESLRKRATELEIEITLLRKEKQAWNTFLESTETNHRPEEISRDLHHERTARKADQQRLQTYETELHDSRARVRNLEQTVEMLTSQGQERQDQLTKTERRLERVDRQKNLAQREVQFLKEQLRTYDSEETVFFNGANVDAQKSARIQSLEGLLEQYKSEIARLNSQPPLSPLATADNGKRKRSEIQLEEDEEARRKIRVLQNGSSLEGTEIDDRFDEISTSRDVFTKRCDVPEITTRVP
jgi:mitotic spindle assembly checkpoint protein MAD1